MNETYENPYKIRLYYGCEVHYDDVYHSFVAVHPDNSDDDRQVVKELKELLDPISEESTFDYNCMDIQIPDSVVQKIKEDAVREFKDDLQKRVFGRMSALSK